VQFVSSRSSDPEWRGLPDRKTQTDRWKSPAELRPEADAALGLRERLHEN